MDWEKELNWLTKECMGKGWRPSMLKCVAVETVYAIWRYRNELVFRKSVSSTRVKEGIIRHIIYRGCIHKKVRRHITTFMM